MTSEQILRMAEEAGFSPFHRSQLLRLLNKFADGVEFEASEARLDNCIEVLEKHGLKDAADILRGEG